MEAEFAVPLPEQACGTGALASAYNGLTKAAVRDCNPTTASAASAVASEAAASRRRRSRCPPCGARPPSPHAHSPAVSGQYSTVGWPRENEVPGGGGTKAFGEHRSCRGGQGPSGPGTTTPKARHSCAQACRDAVHPRDPIRHLTLTSFCSLVCRAVIQTAPCIPQPPVGPDRLCGGWPLARPGWPMSSQVYCRPELFRMSCSGREDTSTGGPKLPPP